MRGQNRQLKKSTLVILFIPNEAYSIPQSLYLSFM